MIVCARDIRLEDPNATRRRESLAVTDVIDGDVLDGEPIPAEPELASWAGGESPGPLVVGADSTPPAATAFGEVDSLLEDPSDFSSFATSVYAY